MKPALVSGKTTTSPLSRIATWPGAIAEPTRTRALSLMMRLGPGGPWGPVGPTAPFSPWGPLGPTGPSDPIGPATPCIPCSPGEPGIPGGPGSPFGPCKPWSPLGSLGSRRALEAKSSEIELLLLLPACLANSHLRIEGAVLLLPSAKHSGVRIRDRPQQHCGGEPESNDETLSIGSRRDHSVRQDALDGLVGIPHRQRLLGTRRNAGEDQRRQRLRATSTVSRTSRR
jgi:hypothetical protein